MKKTADQQQQTAGASSNRLINKYGVRVWKHENWQKQTGVKSAKN